jgi:hypothetical protein
MLNAGVHWRAPLSHFARDLALNGCVRALLSRETDVTKPQFSSLCGSKVA